MRSRLALLMLPAVSACAPAVSPQARAPVALPDPAPWGQHPAPTETLWCVTSAGEIIGYPHGVCPAPASFVRVPVCRTGWIPHDDTPEARAALVRAARDRSLHGDRFSDRHFCAPLPPT